MKAVLLANGPSLASVDFSRLSPEFKVFGMNRSWKVCPHADYHVALEAIHYDREQDATGAWVPSLDARLYHQRLAAKRGLFVAGTGWPCGWVLAFGGGTFSRDVFKDGVVTELGGVGSVFWAACQVAYTLGYRELWALGLDFQGSHFDGSPASPAVARQNHFFQFTPPDLTIYCCGSPDSKANLEHRSLEDLYAAPGA